MTSETPTSEVAGQEVPPRLLIVDDIADNRTILTRRFERRGFQVIEAESGREALDAVGRQDFDLVLLDVMMPEMDGIEVLQRLRQTHSQAALPVIMVTAKSQSEDIVAALTAGANDYVTKPVDFAVALARVEAQVGRKRAEEQARLAHQALSEVNESLERRISERTEQLVETNARLRQAVDEAEVANRVKDKFLTNMSHELRTPLNGVLGMAEMLAKTDLQSSQREIVETIDASALALDSILMNLLDIVDLRSKQLELSCHRISLGDLIRDASAFAEIQARKKGLDFLLDVAPDVEGEVEADPVRLRQVLTNLFSNAVKFTAAGQVALGVQRDASDSARVIFTLTDTGVGFDAALAESLFDDFEQADGSLTRRFGGLGMGLAICREVVRKMGGAIAASGQPGVGAVFRVDLPLPRLSASAPHSPTVADSEAEPGRSKLHVLCAEDHPTNQKLIALIMDAAGIDLTIADDGAQALEKYRNGAFDAVLMDMQMPVMDGLAATRAIRNFDASNGRPAIPIVMLTAHGLPEHIRASREAGVDRHLSKPVAPAALLDVLAEVIT